jgi:hypothetical protein
LNQEEVWFFPVDFAEELQTQKLQEMGLGTIRQEWQACGKLDRMCPVPGQLHSMKTKQKKRPKATPKPVGQTKHSCGLLAPACQG